MDIKEAKTIVQFGIKWGNLSNQQIEAMKVALDCMENYVTLKSELEDLRLKNNMYEEELKRLKIPKRINEFMYEMGVDENGEIPCVIEVNGVEHTFGITEKDIERLSHIFRLCSTT